MNLLKKYIVLELCAFLFIFIFAIGCVNDDCVLCVDCLVELNNGIYCESDFTNMVDFTEAIGDLELDNCTCN